MQDPSESLEIKKSVRFDSLESYNSPSRSIGMRNKIKSVWTEQERVYSDKPISLGTIQGNQRFPSNKSPTLMKVEINDVMNKERSADDTPKVEEIWTKQLNQRLANVLNGISTQNYNRREHKKRLDKIQKNLDATFDKKPVLQKKQINDVMHGPAYHKIVAQRKRAQANSKKQKVNPP